MSEPQQTVLSPTHKIKITKWKVREGFQVNVNQVILLYVLEDGDDKDVRRFKSNKCGIVRRRHFTEGNVVDVEQPLLELSNCIHATVIKDMCADCGADLRQDESHVQCEASVPMVHSVPELKVSHELAQELGKADTIRLLNDRRLVLLVDLDQTVIHTTNDYVPHNLKDVYHFQLYGANSPWYHTRLRPGTFQFLENIAPMYELHICTFGARNYAHTIAQFLDEDGKYFSHRILSRDECLSVTYKTENLRALFPCGDSMVCIIDDREDVWNMATNLIQVKPYHFFQHTGDINAPPGMSKHELDGKGVDFGALKKLQAPTETTHSDTDDQKSKESDPEPAVAEAPSEQNDHKNDLEQPGTSREAERSADKDSDDSDNADSVTRNIDENSHDKLVEQDDPDDYLLYLEEILKKIHSRFYTHYDETKQIPDLKTLLPKMRSEVLVGKTLVFTGLVPTQVKLEKSKPYLIARSLGANVTQALTNETTHLVASTAGTFKANAAKKNPNIHIVSSDWLWTCAERWECVDEKVFPLGSSKASKTREPPAHCHSPEHVVNYSNFSEADFSGSEMAHSSVDDTGPKFSDIVSINPLLSFSNDDIKAMNDDVDLSDSSDGDSIDMENPPMSKELRKRKREEDTDDVQRKIFQAEVAANDGEDNDSSRSSISRSDSDEEAYEQDMDSKSELDSNANTTNSSDANDDGDDGEWNMMGAALEREFLGLE